MKKFFLNQDFFDFFLGCYYPVWDNVFLYIISKHEVCVNHKRYFVYHCQFCVHIDKVKNDISSFHVAFDFDVKVCAKKILLCNLEYLMESKFANSQLKYFPLTPCWLLPSIRYTQFLNRCKLALRVYRERDLL